MGSIEKQQRASRAFTRFDVDEVFVANKLGHRLSNGNQETLWRAPTAHRAPDERRALARIVFPVSLDDLMVGLIPLEHLIQRSELLQILGPEMAALMPKDKCPKPLTEPPCLGGGRIQRARQGSTAKRAQRARRHEVRPPKPVDQIVAGGQPFDRQVDRSGDGIQKIDSRRVAYQYRRRPCCFHETPPNPIVVKTKVTRIRPWSRANACHQLPTRKIAGRWPTAQLHAKSSRRTTRAGDENVNPHGRAALSLTCMSARGDQ